MKTIFDLPAHPLLIHLPVVLVPLTAMVAVALAARPQWRRSLGPALAAAVVVATVGTVLAARSGEALNDALKDRIGTLAETHQQLGETTVILTIAFGIAMLAVAIADRRMDPVVAASGAIARSEWLVRVAMGITALVGLLATIWMIRTGHEGATIVWEGVIPDEG